MKLVPMEYWNRRLRVSLDEGKFRASQFRVREMPSEFGDTRHRPAKHSSRCRDSAVDAVPSPPAAADVLPVSLRLAL